MRGGVKLPPWSCHGGERQHPSGQTPPLFREPLPKPVAFLPAEGDPAPDVVGGRRREPVTGLWQPAASPHAAPRHWRWATCKLNKLGLGAGGSPAALAHGHSRSPGREPTARLGPRLGGRRGQRVARRTGRQITAPVSGSRFNYPGRTRLVKCPLCFPAIPPGCQVRRANKSIPLPAGAAAAARMASRRRRLMQAGPACPAPGPCAGENTRETGTSSKRHPYAFVPARLRSSAWYRQGTCRVLPQSLFLLSHSSDQMIFSRPIALGVVQGSDIDLAHICCLNESQILSASRGGLEVPAGCC